MKIIALEEHLVTAEVSAAWAQLPDEFQDIAARAFAPPEVKAQLNDLNAERLRRMDEVGVDVQVLSLTTPGVQNLEPDDAVTLARATNDRIAATVQGRPDRFEGFATLPTPAPGAAAADELRRAVGELGLKGAMLCGRTRARNLDHADFLPIFKAANHLRVPLYIHPQGPQQGVRDAYYSGFGDRLDTMFATAGIGWHYETGIQLLRLVLAGVFDLCPDLQIILGHWGEVVLFYLERIDMLSKGANHLQRPVAEYVRHHVHVTPSGLLSQSYLQRSIEILGVDRILFAIDYPYISPPAGAARSFFEEATLSPADREKIAHGNWERLTRR